MSRSPQHVISRSGARLALSAALALALVATSASAQERQSLPPEKTSQGVTYVSGGVGLDESTALKAARRDFSLAVEVFQSSGSKNEYTTAVPLTISRPNGELVFEAVTEGPYTLLRLAPGRYIVKATLNGKIQQRQVAVGKSPAAKASFVFKESKPQPPAP